MRFRKLLLTSALAVTLQFSTPLHAEGVGFGDALIDAADQGNITAVNSMLSSGKYVDTRGIFETTALHRAAYRGHAGVVKRLLEKGADPNVRDVGGATPLHLATRQGHNEIVTLLLSYKADINAADKEGWTPLMRAASTDDSTMTTLLLEQGASVDITNSRGETALIHAVRNNAPHTTRILTEKGADARIKDQDGFSAADIAFRNNNSDIQAILSQQPVYSVKPVAAEVPVQTAAPIVVESKKTDMEKQTGPGQYLIQLGTFGTRQQTAFKWQNLKEAHEDELEDLELVVSASAPIGENQQTSYHMQAGYFDSKQEADSRCTALFNAGVDCFVLAASPSGKDVPAVEAAIARIEQSASPETAIVPKAAEMEPLTTATETEGEPLPWVITQPGSNENEEDIIDLAIAEMDAKSEAEEAEEFPALNDVPESPATTTPEPVTTPAPLIEVAEEKPSEEVVIVEAVQPETVAEKLEKEIDEDFRIVASSPLPETTPQREPEAIETQPAPTTAPIEEAKPAEVVTIEAPVSPRPLTTLPPAPVAPTSTTATEDAAIAETANDTAIEVAEAIRVPLTQPTIGPAPTVRTAPAFHPTYRPSNPSARATSWLQIGYFSSEQDALIFWNGIRQQHPELAQGMRYSTNRPYQNRQYARTALRVGPYVSAENAKTLCDIARHSGNLGCQTIQEQGNSTALRARARVPSYEYANYRQQMRNTAYTSNMSDATPSAYWVQIGTYPSRDDARSRWNELNEVHHDILGSYEYRVKTPAYSSSSRAIYRLHAGPFQSKDAANEVCNMLKERHISCLSIKGQ